LITRKDVITRLKLLEKDSNKKYDKACEKKNKIEREYYLGYIEAYTNVLFLLELKENKLRKGWDKKVGY